MKRAIVGAFSVIVKTDGSFAAVGHTDAGWQRVVDIVFPGHAMDRWIMLGAVVDNLPYVQIIKFLS